MHAFRRSHFWQKGRAMAWLCCALWSLPVAAQAQETLPPAGSVWPQFGTPTEQLASSAMSLGDALAYARQHKPNLRAMRARIDVARQGVALSRAEWLPQLGATAQLFGGTMNNTTAMFIGVPKLDLPRIGATKVDSEAGWSAAYPSTLIGVGVRQLAFDFGRIAAQTAVADIDLRMAKERADIEQLETDLAVESAYYALLAAQEVDRAAQDALSRAQVRDAMVKVSVERGLRPAIDLTRAEADRTRFEVGTTRSRGGILLAQAVFAAAVGVPDPLLAARAPEAIAEELPAVGDALEYALSHSPNIRWAVQSLLRQQAMTRAISMQWVPTLGLTASIDGRSGGAPATAGPSGLSGWLPLVPNWDIGLVLSVPLFDPLLLARRALSLAEQAVLREEVTAVKRQLLADIQRAYASFRVAQQAKPALLAACEAARKNYEQASARFKAGLGTSVELADAEALRTESEIQLAMGRYEVARTRAVLHRVLASGL